MWLKKFIIEIVFIILLILSSSMRLVLKGSTKDFFYQSEELNKKDKLGFLLFWHNRLFLTFLIMLRFRKRFNNFTVLVSANNDGDIFTELLKRARFNVVRGSANNKSLQALKGIHNSIRKGNIVGYAADGPTGPIYKFKPGAVFLAQKYSVPIHLIEIKANNFFSLSTWDKLIIPFPFSKLHIKKMTIYPDVFEINNQEEEIKINLDNSLEILQEKMDFIINNKFTK